jgi:hypothetical protein
MADVWTLAKHRKGRPSAVFPLLHNTTGPAAENPKDKAQIFREKFFPSELKTVPLHHPTDPPPRQPRHWEAITMEEVTKALATAANNSAPGLSRIGYKLLKWAHAARPDVIPELLTRCLFSGTHPWKQATVVMLNKPKKPDYSIPKAYRPIALMECAGKLLEKIVAKRINADIQEFDLLPMMQYGSRPQHNTMDAVATLVHKIQGTLHTGPVGALILFDISSFFDSINPDRAVAILENKGFPWAMCEWTRSFLMGREASIKIGDYTSNLFPI